jgi:molybdopterin-guanine dinucleotide biosynthesis protein A
VPTHRIAAVILAGGRGSRLEGVVKARLTVGGVPLLERVAAALTVLDGPVLVAQGPHALGGIADPPGWSGPLAGIAAAAGVDAEFLMSVAVDTPFFPPDFVNRALTVIGSADVVVARYGGDAYFTNALWRVSALTTLLKGSPETLSAGGIKGFLRSLDVVWLDWPEAADGNPFANVNTPDDLATLERRAVGIGVGKQGQTR